MSGRTGMMTAGSLGIAVLLIALYIKDNNFFTPPKLEPAPTMATTTATGPNGTHKPGYNGGYADMVEVKIDPVVGMSVSWVDPKSNPRSSWFIQHQLIERYGTEGLTVASVEKTSPGSFRVTLRRGGGVIMSRSEPMKFDWGYLRPVAP